MSDKVNGKDIDDLKSNPIYDELNKRMEETSWDFEQIQNRINKKLENVTRKKIDDYYELYKDGNEHFDMNKLSEIIDSIDFDLDDKTELTTKVTKANSQLAGDRIPTIYIYLKWKIIDGFKRTKNWRYDLSDCKRYKKLGFLFD